MFRIHWMYTKTRNVSGLAMNRITSFKAFPCKQNELYGKTNEEISDFGYYENNGKCKEHTIGTQKHTISPENNVLYLLLTWNKTFWFWLNVECVLSNWSHWKDPVCVCFFLTAKHWTFSTCFICWHCWHLHTVNIIEADVLTWIECENKQRYMPPAPYFPPSSTAFWVFVCIV